MTDIFTLVSKEVLNFLRLWKQTILPSIMTTILYILIFWKFLWDQISSIEGINYIHYIFPWLIMMSIILGSYSITAFGFFTAKMFKHLEELLVSPISKPKIICGYIIAGICRWVLVGILIFMVSLLFIENVTILHPLLALLFAILTSVVFSLAWLLNGIFANSFDDINIIPNFIITPMIYLWWVFYSINMLWDIWKNISQFNPVFYMISGLRYAFLWVSDVNPYISIIILLWFIASLYSLTLYLLNKGFRIRS